MASRTFGGKAWWSYLTENQQDLLHQSQILLEREERWGSNKFHDYAFVVFPAAKAYEGILKKLFFELGTITRVQYENSHFRVGRSLNPGLPAKFRGRDWVFGRLKDFCGGRAPQLLWDTWRLARNLVFHWFPKHKNFVTLPEARKRYEMILRAIDTAYEECGANSKKLISPA